MKITHILVVVAALLVGNANAQTYFTKAKADQITVATNGFTYLKFRNLQNDLDVIDNNLEIISSLLLTPSAVSNYVLSAASASVQDFIDSVPALTDSSVVPLMPSGATLLVSNLVVSGVVTAGTISVAQDFLVGGGSIEATAASAYSGTNSFTAPSNFNWYAVNSNALLYSTAYGVATNGRVNILATGNYRASFSASHWATGSIPTAWVVFNHASGLSISNACSVVEKAFGTATNRVILGELSQPCSSGGVINAFVSYPGFTTPIRGGGVLLVTRTPVQDASGNVVTGSLPGGW